MKLKMKKIVNIYINLKAFSFIRYFFYFTIIIVLLMKKDYHKLKCNSNNTFNNTIISNQESIINFEGFNNKNPILNEQHFIVPNLIHYINLKQSKLEFPLFLNILSVWLHQKPDAIYLHCDDCEYNGKYWRALMTIPELKSILKINKLSNLKMNIFNIKPGFIQHKSDVLRILVLMSFGGIYLDNDMILVNSLDKYRHFEMTVSWDSDKDGIGNQILIANRNARLLKSMFDGYRFNYKPEEWYYNGGYYPAEILLKDRNLAHIVKYKLGTQMLIGQLFKTKNWSEWKQMDTIHLLINHRSYLDKDSSIKEFNEINIINYEYTFGEIARHILNASQIKIN